MKPSLLAVLPLLAPILLAPILTGQTPEHLVGMTRLVPALRHLDHANCSVLGQCALPNALSSAALPAYAGGTAWDPVRSGAWVSNGLLLAKFDEDCNAQCAPIAVPTLTANAYITGLEVVTSSNQLWMIDSVGFLHFYTNTCPPNAIGTCHAGLISTSVAQRPTGLAVDELRNIVFIAFPDAATGTNWIYVSRLNTPCQPLTHFQLPHCLPGFGVVTGLACDWGNRRLYATDGSVTLALNYGWVSPSVVPGTVTCCGVAISIDTLVGLAIRPGRTTSVGTPCNNGACPNCPMHHSLANDPILGNAEFRLRLDEAPGNSFSFCLIGDGPCLGIGASTPPLCGPIYTLPLLGYLGPNLISGPSTSICGNSTTFVLPLPLDGSLVGNVYSSQCLELCVAPGGALGFALSNCISWRLQGS
ncbi:MAG TPA: hypothetical protein VFZ65_16315 [Planctomycetota bacterium]|nr:hypothetical protein [Planctomycetota bacterium]